MIVNKKKLINKRNKRREKSIKDIIIKKKNEGRGRRGRKPR